MSELPLISVIVPVYKVEAYLDQCIQSIVAQTYKNLEILLVDDGSPDNSGAICDAWAEKDSRIRVIHKENGGGGQARNTALEIAKGELISFVDSDDYLEPHMYTHLHSLMRNDVDISECVIGTTETDQMPMDDGSSAEVLVVDAEEAMRLHIRDVKFCQTPPNKLYRRSAIGNIRFPVGNLIDDEFFTYKVIGNARRLAQSSAVMYAYRQQEGSVMHKPYSLKRLEAIAAKQQRLAYLKEKMPSLVYEGTIDLFFGCMYAMQRSLVSFSGEELTQAKEMIYSALDEIRPVPLSRKLSVKQNLWLALAQMSFEGTCKLQNFLERERG